MKTILSVRSIEDNLVHWYAIINDLRVDYSTRVKEVTDNPILAAIAAEGGEADSKNLIANLIQEKRIEGFAKLNKNI